MRRLQIVAFGVASLMQITAHCAQSGAPGRPLSRQEVALRAISIRPDGHGLPPGAGTSAAGKLVYDSKCAACHGAHGEGTEVFPQLVGGIGSLTAKEPVLTIGSYWPYATTVWDYINRAMPYQAAGTLTAQEVYDVTAYLLHMNGIIGAHQKIDAQTLPAVVMPNRNGFVDDPRPGAR